MKAPLDIHRILLEMATLRRRQDAAGNDTVPTIKTAEQEHLDELVSQQRELQRAAAAAELTVEDMEAEILRIQQDERKIRRRIDDDKAQLGATTDPEIRRDLEHDLYSAKSRRGDLLSELAEAHNEVHALRANRDRYGAQLDELSQQIEKAERARDAAVTKADERSPEELEAHLAQLRSALPEDILDAYETAYRDSGAGAAYFNGRACGGCYLVLPVADRTRIRQLPADEIAECPQCATLLVRVSPSQEA